MSSVYGLIILLSSFVLFFFLEYWRGRVATSERMAFILPFINPFILIGATIVAVIIRLNGWGD